MYRKWALDRMLPPLNITYEEINRGLDILNKVLSGEKV